MIGTKIKLVMNEFLLHEIIRVNEHNQMKPNYFQLLQYFDHKNISGLDDCIKFLLDRGIFFKKSNFKESIVNLEISVNVLKEQIQEESEDFIQKFLLSQFFQDFSLLAANEKSSFHTYIILLNEVLFFYNIKLTSGVSKID